MKGSLFAASFLGAIGLAAASPAISTTPIAPTRTIDIMAREIGTLGIPKSGALGPTPAGHNEAADFPPAPPLITLMVANKAGVALTTTHGINTLNGTVDVPPQGGVPGPGTIAVGATKTMLYPTGWGGNIAFNNAKYRIQGDETLIEASFKRQKPEHQNAGFAINVSFVNGHTYPIMCYCTSSGGVPLKGCTEQLWLKSQCPADLNNGQGACKNPLRPITGLGPLEPHPFFKPCQTQAYTYPDDDQAVSNGACQSGTITCEVLANGLN